MSIWIVAWCTRSAGELTVERLVDETELYDFAAMAEVQGLDEETGYAAGDELRFEQYEEDGSRYVLMYYRPGNDRFIRMDVHREEFVRTDATETLADDDYPARIRDVLGRATHSYAFDLKLSDVDGMGWPIAWQLAMWLAEQGDGIVQADDEWWDPRTDEQIPE